MKLIKVNNSLINPEKIICVMRMSPEKAVIFMEGGHNFEVVGTDASIQYKLTGEED